MAIFPVGITYNLQNAIFTYRRGFPLHLAALPTWEQLYNEISATKKCMNKNPPMFNTFQKRQYIEIYLNVPGDNYEAYIPYYEIHDEDKKNLRFTVIFSSTVCLARFVLFLCV